MDRFCLEKPSNMEVKGQYQIKISGRLAAFKNMDAIVDINRASENMGEHIKISATERVIMS
jgi:hypothetical protein